MADASLRETMNQGEAQRLADLDRELMIGEFINSRINAMTATEAGIAVTTNVSTLAATPLVLWDAKVATVSGGAATGSKKVLKVSDAYLTANNPAAGTCFWNGDKKVKFASADLAATADFKYPKAADATCSFMQRTLGQIDG